MCTHCVNVLIRKKSQIIMFFIEILLESKCLNSLIGIVLTCPNFRALQGGGYVG